MSGNGIANYSFIVFDELPSHPLLSALRQAFLSSMTELEQIAKGFRDFTSSPQSPEMRRTFFHSWSMTNHSAMCVSGISNRLSYLLYKNIIPEPRRPRLVDAIVALNRISDEDLGANGGRLHADFFYDMATTLCGDDKWQRHIYALPQATAFQDYKNQISLKNRDIFLGILTTLIHEIYTHGEVEFIQPLFRQACQTQFGLSQQDSRKCLAWILVHCGGTEANHFKHALKAAVDYAEANGLDLENYGLETLFKTYLQHKAAVMTGISAEIARRKMSALTSA